MSLSYLLGIEQRIVPSVTPIKFQHSPALQRKLCQFISTYHQALLERDLSQLSRLYAPAVKYHQLGTISKQIVVEEKQAYFERWHYVEQTLLDTPKISSIPYSTDLQVNYLFKFRVYKLFGSPLSTAGKGRQGWRLQKTPDSFVIVEENQQVFYRYDD